MLINKLFVFFTKNKMCILCSATNFIIKLKNEMKFHFSLDLHQKLC